MPSRCALALSVLALAAQVLVAGPSASSATVPLWVTHATSGSVAGVAPAPLAGSGATTPAARLARRHDVAAVAARERNAPALPHAQGHPRLDPRTRLLRPARNGTVTVTVTGSAADTATQVRRLGGRVLTSIAGQLSAVVPKAALTQLSDASGVSQVSAPTKAFVEGAPSPGPSQGVAASGADVWQNAGKTGANVKVGIVDGGFSNLAAETLAGHLPANITLVNEDCVDDDNNPSVDVDEHGTAVAEVIHQMAPGAQLFLYCVGDDVGFASAETDLHSAGVTIVNSSLGFASDSRGDGTGSATSTAATVERARKAGILWVESAGNNGEDHWSGTLADTDHDGIVDIGGPFDETTGQFENDVVFVAPGTTAVPAQADASLQWEQWPTTSAAITFALYGYQCTDDFSGDGIGGCDAQPIDPDADDDPTPQMLSQSPGTPPTLDIPLSNTSAFDQFWQVDIYLGGTSYPGVRYDLSYWGDVDGPSVLACPATTASGDCIVPTQASAGSITDPASSPYALAVGAVDVGADGSTPGKSEPFSSQGPTIDGRIKPDLGGWDGVSSYLDDFSTGFYGTSAAAPHVTGAAALASGANPSMDAAQLQTFLEQHADSGSSINPATNRVGHGVLTLGAAQTPVLPVGSGYTPTVPFRALDTRNSGGPLRAGQAVTLTLPAAAGTATAVAINLTGTGAANGTYLSVYPGGSAFPGTSNLNLSKTDPTAAVFAVVPLGPGRTIQVLNGGTSANAIVDVLGYFTATSTGLYAPLTARRIADTRSGIGGHTGRVGGGQVVREQATALPPGTTSIVVDATVADEHSSGWIGLGAPGAASARSTSTLNYAGYDRANLAVVQVDSTGHFDVVGGPGIASADVILDLVGAFSTSGTSTFVPLPAPVRIVDTRSGNGGVHSPLGVETVYGAGINGVPFAATALLAGLVAVAHSGRSLFTVYPATQGNPGTSNLNFTAGRVVPNAVVMNLGGRSGVIANRTGAADAVMDLFGYFEPVAG
jgi:Subtilase family